MKECNFTYGTKYLHVIIKNGNKEDWYDEFDEDYIYDSFVDEEGEHRFRVEKLFNQHRLGAELYIDSSCYDSRTEIVSEIIQTLVRLSMEESQPDLNVLLNNINTALIELLEEF